MSTCISRHGEWSDHVLAESGPAAERYVCSRCFALAEDALLAEVDRLTEALEAGRAQLRRQPCYPLGGCLKAAHAEQLARAERAEADLWELREHIKTLAAIKPGATGRALRALLSDTTTGDDHDHEWTPCPECPNVGKPCICSGGACPECPTAATTPPHQTPRIGTEKYRGKS